MLTNFKTIQTRIKRLHDLEKWKKKAPSTFCRRKKLSFCAMKWKIGKYLGGIKNMKKLPSALFVIDPRKEHNAILEARKLHIPIVATVDTNCDPDEVDYLMPANDDAIRAVRLLTSKMADAVLEGKASAVDEEAVAAEEENAAEEAAQEN